MNRKLLISILAVIVVLFTIEGAFAAWYESTVPIYEFETSGAQGKDFNNLLNATLGSATTNTTGIVGSSAINCGAASSTCGFNISDSGYLNPTASQSIGFWYKGNPASLGYLFRKGATAQYYGLLYTNGSIEFGWNLGGTLTPSTTSVDIGDSAEHCVVLIYNGTHQYAVIDNTTNAASLKARSGAITTGTGNATFFSDRGGSPLSGVMDEVFFANRSMTTAEIQAFCSKVPATPPSSAPSTPSWVVPTPANGATNNTQVTLNASSTSPGVRYYIWFDTNPNPTTLVVNNASTGNYTTSVPGTTTTYYYKAAVWNSTGNFSSNTTINNWTFDAVAPSITLNALNEFSVLNLSQQNPYDKSVVLNITFADDHDLYGMSVNITRGGTVYFNITNETLDGLTYNYTNTLNATEWPAGRYNVTLEVSDSHTAKEIKPYDVQKQAKGLRFQTAEGNDITIESTDGSDAIVEKKLDRYEFEFTFDDGKQKSRTFHVRSDKPIVYKANSAYKAHFVVSTGRGGNWIDFEGVTGTPSVTRINDFHYTVTFADVPAKARFKSIGGLNVLSVNYTFYVGNYSVLNPSPIYAREAGTFGLNVTTESTFTNTTAVLVYNGSTYISEVTSSSSLYNFTTVATAPNATVNLTYNWTVMVFQQNGVNFTFNVSTVQVVQDWTIVSCGTPQFINWTQYDEDNPSTKLTGTFAVEVEYWVGNRSNAKLYNATFGSANSWALCFSPTDARFSANIYGQNAITGGFTHRFYTQNVTYSNSTTNYSIYNTPNTSVSVYSDMKITTRYVTSYGYFKNVFAQLQRRYVGEGVWRTVQYDKSGDFGLLFFDIKEQSVDYRIKYYDENNSLLLETDSLKFVCTAAVCELTQLIDPASATTESPDIETVVTFNNATSVLTVEWDSASSLSSSVAIKVQKQNYNGLVTVCSTTQTGVAGSFDCNATGYTGELFVTVDVDGEQNAAEYVPIGRTSIASNMSKATQALVTFLLMLAIIAFGLFSPIALVIMTVLSLIVVFFLGTLSAITATFIIIAAVMGFVIAIKVKQ